jgi:ATP-binding cassette subfamily B protein
MSTAIAPKGLPGRHGSIAVEKPKNTIQAIRRLWVYLRQQKKLLVFIPVLLLINTGANITGSYLLRPIINNYIIPHDVQGLIKMIFVLLGIYLIGSVAFILQNRLMIIAAQKTVGAIREDLFSRLQSLPLQYFDTHNHGDIPTMWTILATRSTPACCSCLPAP